MKYEYDYLIVGAGLLGCVFANIMSNKGKRCIVIDKRNHIGGNCYTSYENDIHIHRYGSHIFHTDNKIIWDYIRNFGKFDNYINRVKANCDGVIYSLPINLLTFNKLWGVTTPEEAKHEIESRIIKIDNPKNAEEYLLSKVGKEITSLFYEGYTKKHWGIPLKELPISTYTRLPIRFNFDDNYYNHKYQGIPIDGYTKLFEKMLEKSVVSLNTNYFKNKNKFDNKATKILYTGPIDKFFYYKYGILKYINIDFKFKWFDVDDYQGCAVMSHPLYNVPYTKTIEHKHFIGGTYGKKTIVSKEFPIHNVNKDSEKFYPVNDKQSINIFNKYKKEMTKNNKFIFGGRLADYKYYDMHEVVARAMELTVLEN